MFEHTIVATDQGGVAREGRFETPHGIIETPMFMPVATQGTVKGLTPRTLSELGATIVLSNTYHLYLRPGTELLDQVGGLRALMGWGGPILTDSGGYQVFSLTGLRRLSEDGVEFQSHIDGSRHFLSPEKVVAIQESIGSDIMMPLDECPPIDLDRRAMETSVARTTRWEKRCLEARRFPERQALFAIVQGGLDHDIRKAHAEELTAHPFDGFAIGGLSVGESQADMYRTGAFTAALLPKDKPRYLMGVGTPVDLVTMAGHGVDLFDCVLPTRTARNGLLYTDDGPIQIKNSRYKADLGTPDASCSCYTCRTFSRAYLRHLFMAKEILSAVLHTIHNLHYYFTLMARIRLAIRSSEPYDEFAKSFRARYEARAIP